MLDKVVTNLTKYAVDYAKASSLSNRDKPWLMRTNWVREISRVYLLIKLKRNCFF